MSRYIDFLKLDSSQLQLFTYTVIPVLKYVTVFRLVLCIKNISHKLVREVTKSEIQNTQPFVIRYYKSSL